jgi:hypothetical protein
MKKRVLAVTSLVCIVLIALAVYRWFSHGRPTEWAFARIKPGQTLQEVEAILGPGQEIQRGEVPQVADYAARMVAGKLTTYLVEGDRFFIWSVEWSLDGGNFYVSFKDDKVVEKYHNYQTLS